MDQLFDFSGRLVTLTVKGASLGSGVLQFQLRGASGQAATFALDPMANAQRLHLQSNLLIAAATHGLIVQVSAKRADPVATAVDVGVSVSAPAASTAKSSAPKATAAKKSAKKAASKRRR